MDHAVIIAATVLTAGILLLPRVANATLWRATTTPLASIIGSGFLVLGPILAVNYGKYATLAMIALCATAWAFGSMIRSNIASRDAGPLPAAAEWMDTTASWALAFAYVISVAYYLNLFGAFALSLTPWDARMTERGLTTAIYALILLIGWTRGFSALERMEQVSVGLKLAIIAGLIAGLTLFAGEKLNNGGLVLLEPALSGWPALTLAFGLIVTVQGFETSRYLGEDYDARTRIRSMQLSQTISATIYVVYILGMAYLFHREQLSTDETAIIHMMSFVSPILPPMLVGAAIAAQFSAAVADTGGAGGLVAELTGGKVGTRMGYAILVALGVALTWTADVFTIIRHASRAFALYYGLQSAITAIVAWTEGARLKAGGAGLMAALGLAIAAFGTAVEGG